MRQVVVLVVLFGSFTGRPVMADEPLELLLKSMGAAVLSPLVAIVLESPLLVAAWARGTEIAPRPTAGRARMETTLPWRDDEMVMMHLSLGGYVGPESRFGWEARSNLYAFRDPPLSRQIHMQWDGLGLFDLSAEAGFWSAEMLLGGTLWPSFGDERGWQWRGGVAVGVRVGTWTVRRLFRVEAEALQSLTGSEHFSGIQRTTQLRAGASIGVPTFGQKRASTNRSALGLSYVGMFSGPTPGHLPRTSALLLSATF